jgi:hypothetical protein
MSFGGWGNKLQLTRSEIINGDYEKNNQVKNPFIRAE